MKEFKYGVVSGKFRLLHQGHKEYLINAISEKIDELHIIIADSNGKRYSSINELKQAISEIVRDYDVPYYIHFYEGNEHVNTLCSSNVWDTYVIETVLGKKISEATQEEIDDIVIYNSKEDYSNELIHNKYLQTSNHLQLSVSNSNIEDNPYTDEAYLYIAPEFARYLNKKVVISGIESSGKTQLCKRLAAIYNTAFSDEVGRFYNIDYMGGSKYYEGVFSPKDFPLIAMKQIIQDKDTNQLSRRILLIDSDPVITLRFLYFYKEMYQKSGEWTADLEDEFVNAENLLETLISTYKVDMVLLLKPAPFVQDGTRYEISNDERIEQYNILKGLYDKYNINYIEVNFNGSFTQRLKNVIHIINNELLILNNKKEK